MKEVYGNSLCDLTGVESKRIRITVLVVDYEKSTFILFVEEIS